MVPGVLLGGGNRGLVKARCVFFFIGTRRRDGVLSEAFPHGPAVGSCGCYRNVGTA